MSSTPLLPNEAELLKRAQGGDKDAFRFIVEAYQDRVATSPNDCDESAVAQTAISETYPTTANTVYYLAGMSIDADDQEGSDVTLAGDGNEYFAVNLGTRIPPPGTNVLISSVGGRWVFRWDGS